MKGLVSLPGVGRKTARRRPERRVRKARPAGPTRTVLRSRRLALADQDGPRKVEAELNPMVPAAERGLLPAA